MAEFTVRIHHVLEIDHHQWRLLMATVETITAKLDQIDQAIEAETTQGAALAKDLQDLKDQLAGAGTSDEKLAAIETRLDSILARLANVVPDVPAGTVTPPTGVVTSPTDGGTPFPPPTDGGTPPPDTGTTPVEPMVGSPAEVKAAAEAPVHGGPFPAR
jgi:hypothetical protein